MTFKKSRKKIILLILGLTVALGVGISLASPQTAQRIYRLVLRDRILAPIWIALTTPRENVETTRLPIYELDIAPRYQRELDTDLRQNKYWFREALLIQSMAADDADGDDGAPPSYEYYKPAIFRYNGIRYPVEVRYRGDNDDHREGYQKSWRIKFKKNDRFANQRLINLINPKTPTGLTLAAGYEMARELGLLCPDSYFVHKVVNRQYEGVSLFVEQIDTYYLVNHGLPEGNIYYGEWHPPDECPPGESLLENPRAWTPARIMVPEDPRPGGGAIERFIRALTIEDNEQFIEEFSKIFDLDDWYDVYAHAAICGYFHCDTFHNHKYYLDPTSGKLKSIIWSLNGLGYPQEIRDQDFFPPTNVTNLCTGRIMGVPELTERKNLRLWEHLQGKLTMEKELAIYDRLYALIRDDMRADAYKDAQDGLRRIYTNEAWEAEVRMQRQWIKDRYAYLCQALNADDCRLGLDRQIQPAAGNAPEDKQILAGLLLTNGGECGVRLQTLELTNTAGWTDGEYTLYYDADENGMVSAPDLQLASSCCEKSRAGCPQHDQELAFAAARAFLPGRIKVSPDHWSYWKKLLPYELKSCPARYRLLLTGPRQEKDAEIAITRHDVINNVTGAIVNVQPLGDLPNDTVKGTRPFAFDDGRRVEKTIMWGPGKIQVDADVIIPRTTKLIIAPGTTVALAAGASILCYGPVSAQGTAESWIRFIAQTEQPWGVLALQGDGASGSEFHYCHFTGGKDGWMDHVFYSGMVSAHNSDVLLEDCVFEAAQGDDSVNFKHGDRGVLRRCRFAQNSADGLDLDFSRALVENCDFIANGNDGIDLGTASATIRNCRIRGSGDKGISVGEKSFPSISNTQVEGNQIGIASKDGSDPLIIDCVVTGNKLGLTSYQKKTEYTPSAMRLRHCIVQDNQITLATDMNSTMSIRHCRLPANVQIHPLPQGLLDEPFAPTQMIRPCDWQGMDIVQNITEDSDTPVLTTADNATTVPQDMAAGYTETSATACFPPLRSH